MALHPDKRPFKVVRKFKADVMTYERGEPRIVKDVQHVEYEADFWEAPDGSSNPVGYRTIRATVNELDWSSRVQLPGPKKRGVSFAKLLAAALGVKVQEAA